jgi:hypothetical protein
MWNRIGSMSSGGTAAHAVYSWSLPIAPHIGRAALHFAGNVNTACPPVHVPKGQAGVRHRRVMDDQVYNEALSADQDPTTMVPTMMSINADSLSDGYNAAITPGGAP